MVLGNDFNFRECLSLLNPQRAGYKPSLCSEAGQACKMILRRTLGFPRISFILIQARTIIIRP